MKKNSLKRPPRFLTHHVLLRPACLARFQLPAYLTQHEADRLCALLNALVIETVKDEDNWPFDVNQDLGDDVDELDEPGLLVDRANDEIP